MKPLFPKSAAFCQSPILSRFDDEFVARYLATKPFSKNAVSKRVNEFMTGRWCVSQCFRQKNMANHIVAINKDRSPQWPQGVIGSISHSNSSAIAVIDEENNCSAIGVDLHEKTSAKTAFELRETILHKNEINRFKNEFNPQLFDLIFSSKESLFKGLYPRCSIFFDHQQAEVISIDHNAQLIEINLLRDLGNYWTKNDKFEIKFAYLDSELVTFLYLPK